MGLKTLNDLNKNGNYIMKTHLKAEAVKRVKNCKEQIGFKLLCKHSVIGHKCLGCKRDIWFNNITEEDLK